MEITCVKIGLVRMYVNVPKACSWLETLVKVSEINEVHLIV